MVSSSPSDSSSSSFPPHPRSIRPFTGCSTSRGGPHRRSTGPIPGCSTSRGVVKETKFKLNGGMYIYRENPFKITPSKRKRMMKNLPNSSKKLKLSRVPNSSTKSKMSRRPNSSEISDSDGWRPRKRTTRDRSAHHERRRMPTPPSSDTDHMDDLEPFAKKRTRIIRRPDFHLMIRRSRSSKISDTDFDDSSGPSRRTRRARSVHQGKRRIPTPPSSDTDDHMRVLEPVVKTTERVNNKRFFESTTNPSTRRDLYHEDIDLSSSSHDVLEPLVKTTKHHEEKELSSSSDDE